jgi:hypothetical protein
MIIASIGLDIMKETIIEKAIAIGGFVNDIDELSIE